MPELRPVSKDNWRELIELKVRDDQKGFVAPNVRSIAELQFGAEYQGHWDLFAFGIYNGETPVGFAMYGLNLPHPETQAFIIRLMVDERYQGKGYGRFAMEQMLDAFHADERIRAAAISYDPENEAARRLYASLGFVEPGVMLEGEVLAVIKLI